MISNHSFGGDSESNREFDVDDAYGGSEERFTAIRTRKPKSFAPWHHPVKQMVRSDQWVSQIERLIGAGHVSGGVLRLFTLPGADMMDVRYIASRLKERADGPWKVDVFGFDRTYADTGGGQASEPEALAILRQDNLITIESQLIPGQLEEITFISSLAAQNLSKATSFDVINFDACNHLCREREDKRQSLFNALLELCRHQLTRKEPWLLFVTTRADSENFIGPTAEKLKSIVSENIANDGEVFLEALIAATGRASDEDGGASASWSGEGESFLKIFSVGLGKYLLHYFNSQIGQRAEVELKSTYGYRVAGHRPDMLAVAFCVRPLAKEAVPLLSGRHVPVPSVNPHHSAQIARRSAKLLNLDLFLEQQPTKLKTAVTEQASLLSALNYSTDRWLDWLRLHKVRPMDCTGAEFGVATSSMPPERVESSQTE